MNKLRIATITFSLVLAPLATASAQEFARMGMYVRGGLVAGFENSKALQNAIDQTDYSYEVDTFISGAGAIGYRFHPFFALDVQFEYLGESDVKLSGTDFIPGQGTVTFNDTKVATIKIWDVTGNVRAYPLTGVIPDRFQPFALIGMGYGKGEVSSDNAALQNEVGGSEGGFIVRFGGGLDFYITEHIALYGEGSYVLTTGDIEDTDFGTLGAGAMWRF